MYNVLCNVGNFVMGICCYCKPPLFHEFCFGSSMMDELTSEVNTFFFIVNGKTFFLRSIESSDFKG